MELIVGLIVIIILFILSVIIEVRAQSVREKTAQEAHKQVIKLRQQGVNAEICPVCLGKGRHSRGSIVTRPCDRCGGVGYIYDKPAIK
jgi:DnaJ-class molecular chaperone